MNAVLKDSKNRPGGYIRETDGGAVCRIYMDQQMFITLIFDDGTQKILKIAPGAGENTLACDGRRIRCAYAFDEERLLLATDAAARKAFMCRKRNDTSAHALTVKENETLGKATSEKPTGLQKRMLRTLPQRRWPPPPCLMEAVYHFGRWTEQKVQISEECSDRS